MTAQAVTDQKIAGAAAKGGLTAAQLLAKAKAAKEKKAAGASAGAGANGGGAKPKAAAKKNPAPASTPAAAAKEELNRLPVELIALSRIKLGENPTRTYVENSDEIKAFGKALKRRGIINPLVVRPKDKATGKYELIAGFRRYAGAKAAGIGEVPCRIWSGATEGLNFDENMQRRQPSAVEVALYIKAKARENKWKLPYIDGDPQKGKGGTYNVKEMAAELGKSAAYVTEHCKLLKLPDKLLDMVHTSQIKADAAFKFANLPEDCRDEVMAVIDAERLKKEAAAAEAKAKAKEEAAAKATEKEGKAAKSSKVTPTAASRETVAAAKRERQAKAAVTSKDVSKAAAKVAKDREEAGDVDTAREIRSAVKGGAQARTLGEFDQIMEMINGESEKCTEMHKMYSEWRAGTTSADDLAEWLVALAKLAEENSLEMA